MSARRRHENRTRTGKTYVINNTEGPGLFILDSLLSEIFQILKSFSIFTVEYISGDGSILKVPSWAKQPSTTSPAVAAVPAPESDIPNLEFRRYEVSDPEDMSKDRTNEFLTICRSIGTSAQVFFLFQNTDSRHFSRLFMVHVRLRFLHY